jgi:hypothetical protein
MAGEMERLLSLVDGHAARVRELRQVTQPGAAPATRAFQLLLTQSMARLGQSHEAFRLMVDEELGKP